MSFTAHLLQQFDSPATPARVTSNPGNFAAIGNLVCALLTTIGLEPGQEAIDGGWRSDYDAPQPLDHNFPRAAHGGFGSNRCLGRSVAVLSKPRLCAA